MVEMMEMVMSISMDIGMSKMKMGERGFLLLSCLTQAAGYYLCPYDYDPSDRKGSAIQWWEEGGEIRYLLTLVSSFAGHGSDASGYLSNVRTNYVCLLAWLARFLVRALTLGRPSKLSLLRTSSSSSPPVHRSLLQLDFQCFGQRASPRSQHLNFSDRRLA
eukprot:761767-Hanusia_phi.AAC.2